MNFCPSFISRSLMMAGLSLGLGMCLGMPSEATAQTAAELASKLSSIRQDGTSAARLRMEINGGGSLQIQTKERRTATGSDSVYQILFPKERKGESVLLRQSSSGSATGASFVPPDRLTTLGSAQMKQGLFGSDLNHEDILENFYAWPQQSLVGTENIGRVSCQILESKPGKNASSYASVKSWVDVKRMVPLRVEKYNSGGAVLLRLETMNVAKDDLGRHLPANLHISRAGSSGSGTLLEGSRIKHGVSLSDADFTPEALGKE